MHLKMSSAEVVCCKYLHNITDKLSIEANSVDPEQTVPIGAFVCLFVFVALRPMSTALVIAGRSVHLTTPFPGQA